MVEYLLVEYADMHLIYGEAQCNSTEARRIYAERFPMRTLPHRRTFERVDRSLRETGKENIRKVLKQKLFNASLEVCYHDAEEKVAL